MYEDLRTQPCWGLGLNVYGYIGALLIRITVLGYIIIKTMRNPQK